MRMCDEGRHALSQTGADLQVRRQRTRPAGTAHLIVDIAEVATSDVAVLVTTSCDAVYVDACAACSACFRSAACHVTNYVG